MDVSSLPDLVSERTTDGLVEAMGRLIKRGVVRPGERLPTVREVAATLGMGLATVSAAWGRLIEAGMIETRGRAGSFVPHLEQRTAARFFRYSRRGDFRLDLSTGLPDPRLLPSPARALADIDELPQPSSYVADPVVPALEEQIRHALPFSPQSLTVVDGALDALDRLLGVWVRLGDRVAVEDPGFPPIFDLVDAHRGQSVAVDTDRDGMVPDSLARALTLRPVVVIIQPRAQNPTGVSMSETRARELAEVLEGHREVWVIEDDHSGAISSRPLVSLGPFLGGRVVHITSFSKSHGPDFRLAGVAGPSVVVERLDDRRRLGPAWSPRLLQRVLAAMLADPESRSQVEKARSVYADRRAKLASALAERGVETSGADGLNLWVRVPDEQATLVTLASHGVAVAPGRPFLLRPSLDGHVRVTTGATSTDLSQVAELLAA